MQFQRYIIQMFSKVRGQLPTVSFIWYTLLLCSGVMVIVLIAYSYYTIFIILHDQETMRAATPEYKVTINKTELKAVLEKYGLE